MQRRRQREQEIPGKGFFARKKEGSGAKKETKEKNRWAETKGGKRRARNEGRESKLPNEKGNKRQEEDERIESKDPSLLSSHESSLLFSLFSSLLSVAHFSQDLDPSLNDANGLSLFYSSSWLISSASSSGEKKRKTASEPNERKNLYFQLPFSLFKLCLTLLLLLLLFLCPGMRDEVDRKIWRIHEERMNHPGEIIPFDSRELRKKRRNTFKLFW